jgi:hypothetical protein
MSVLEEQYSRPSAEADSRPALLAWLPRRLFEPSRPVSYLLLAWPLVAIPAVGLSFLAARFLHGQGAPDFKGAQGLLLLSSLVLFAPMVETLIMGTVLVVLRRFVGMGPAVLMSAAGWGIAHSLSAPAWGLVIWWPFLIFSTAFLVWRTHGFWRAWALVSLLHALQNLIPALLVTFRH